MGSAIRPTGRPVPHSLALQCSGSEKVACLLPDFLSKAGRPQRANCAALGKRVIGSAGRSNFPGKATAAAWCGHCSFR